MLKVGLSIWCVIAGVLGLLWAGFINTHMHILQHTSQKSFAKCTLALEGNITRVLLI